jgi:hypothetical protein
MNLNLLYLNTIQDLNTKIMAFDDYSLLQSSALMRKLLLEDFPLVDKINRLREDKVKIFFTINDAPLNKMFIDSLVFSVRSDGFDPQTARRANPKVVRRKEFFAYPVAYIRGQDISVRDVIQFAAHVQGGVHHRNSDSEVEKKLEEFSMFMRVNGLDSVLYLLRSIGRVLLRGLDPLTKAVEQGIKKQFFVGG